MWAIFLMFMLAIINILSFKGLLRCNIIIFSFKIAVIVLTILVLPQVSFHISNFSDITQYSFSLSGWQNILSAVAAGGIAFAFTGFKHGVELAGEAKNSKVSVPVSIIGSVLCCLLLYLGLQISFIGALDPTALQNGWQNLSFKGDAGPFAGLAVGLGVLWLAKLLYIDAAVSPLGTGLIYVTSTARILYAMSKVGYVPKFLSNLNHQNLPVWAIIVNSCIGIFLFLPFPGWQSMVSFLVSAMVLSYAMGPVALFCLRLEIPEEKRNFRLPFASVLCVLAFYCCNLFSYWTGWETISKFAIAIIIGFAFFGISYLKGKVRNELIGWQSAYWIIPYLAGFVLISYLGAFGGINVIPFGWDFVVIGIFSFIIFYLAVSNRASVTGIEMENYLASGI